MKRIAGFFLALLLLCPSFPARTESSAATEFLQCLNELTAFQERILEIRQEMLQAFAAFCAGNDYAGLLEARIACDEAVQALRQTSPPEFRLSDDALRELTARGVETDAAEAEFWNAAAAPAREIDFVQGYEALLYSAVYQKSQLSTLQNWLNVGNMRLELDKSYHWNLLNALLAPLEEPEARAFWEELSPPCLGEAKPAWETSREALWERAETLLDDYGALSGDASAALGYDSYAVDRYAAAMRAGDAEALKEDRNPVAGFPQLAPLPEDWLFPADTTLYPSRPEEGTKAFPEALTLYTKNVSLEQIERYLLRLTGQSVVLCQRTGSDGEGWQYTLVAGEAVLLIRWETDGTALLSYDPRSLSLEAAAYLSGR